MTEVQDMFEDMLKNRRLLVGEKFFNMVTTASKSRVPMLRALMRLIEEERSTADRIIESWRLRAEHAEEMLAIQRQTIAAHREFMGVLEDTSEERAH